MKIEIEVSPQDADRAVFLGLIPWMRITGEQKKEYERLIGLFGTAVCLRLLNK